MSAGPASSRPSAADAFALKAGSEVAAGIHTADSASITVAQAADLWICRGERDNLEAATLLDYRGHLKLHILPYLGSTKLSRLTVPAVNAFRDRLLDDGRSHDMARRVLKSLAALVGEAQSRGLAATNNVRAIARVKRGARSETRPVMPTRDELRAIITATPDQHRPFILTAVFTGMRGSELRGLSWDAVDLKRGEIHVRQRADCFNTIGPPKSKAGTRMIPLSPLLLNTLKSWRLACPKSELDLVFPTKDGQIQSHSNPLWQIFWPIQIAAGVTAKGRDGKPDAKYSLHALRHAAAALLIEQGLGPKWIQMLMGHASVMMTFDVYGYLFTSHEADTTAMAAIRARLVD